MDRADEMIAWAIFEHMMERNCVMMMCETVRAYLLHPAKMNAGREARRTLSFFLQYLKNHGRLQKAEAILSRVLELARYQQLIGWEIGLTPTARYMRAIAVTPGCGARKADKVLH